MKHVGIREFRDKATGLLRGAEPLAVERHGKVVGFYIPVEKRGADGEQFRDALSRLERAVEDVVRSTDMSEEELAEALDLSQKPRSDGETPGRSR